MMSLQSVSQRPIITSPFPLISTDAIEPSREEVARANIAVDTLLARGMAEVQRLKSMRDDLAKQLQSSGNPAAALEEVIFQAQRQQIAEGTETPWTQRPASQVDVEAAVRNNTYTSPYDAFARQPPVPLLITQTHPNSVFMSTPNYAVSDIGILPLGNQFIPQPFPVAEPAPDGFVNVVSTVPVSPVDLAPPMQPTWTSREPTYVARAGSANKEAQGAIDVSYQAFISMDSAFWPFPSDL